MPGPIRACAATFAALTIWFAIISLLMFLPVSEDHQAQWRLWSQSCEQLFIKLVQSCYIMASCLPACWRATVYMGSYTHARAHMQAEADAQVQVQVQVSCTCTCICIHIHTTRGAFLFGHVTDSSSKHAAGVGAKCCARWRHNGPDSPRMSGHEVAHEAHCWPHQAPRCPHDGPVISQGSHKMAPAWFAQLQLAKG